MTSQSTTREPYDVLGIPRDADEGAIRARYLELVKQYPPDREPERFREIRAAFEAMSDPFHVARELIAPPDDDLPEWDAMLEAQKRIPPRLSPEFLISLGNRRDAGSRNQASPGSATGRTP